MASRFIHGSTTIGLHEKVMCFFQVVPYDVCRQVGDSICSNSAVIVAVVVSVFLAVFVFVQRSEVRVRDLARGRSCGVRAGKCLLRQFIRVAISHGPYKTSNTERVWFLGFDLSTDVASSPR